MFESAEFTNKEHTADSARCCDPGEGGSRTQNFPKTHVISHSQA